MRDHHGDSVIVNGVTPRNLKNRVWHARRVRLNMHGLVK